MSSCNHPSIYLIQICQIDMFLIWLESFLLRWVQQWTYNRLFDVIDHMCSVVLLNLIISCYILEISILHELHKSSMIFLWNHDIPFSHGFHISNMAKMAAILKIAIAPRRYDIIIDMALSLNKPFIRFLRKRNTVR